MPTLDQPHARHVATGDWPSTTSPELNTARNRRPSTDPLRFAQGSRRYGELRLLEKAGGRSSTWKRNRRYRSTSSSFSDGRKRLVNCGRFTADFRYVVVATGEVVIEDTKSAPTKTTAYRLRKRLIEAIHGVTITEV